jgi:hypothetical protein
MKLSEKQNHKFIEEKNLSDWNVETEDGFKPIISTNKTIEYEVFEIILEDDLSLKCADTHILIKEDYEEVYAIDSLGKYIRTKTGPKKVLSVKSLGYSENMYDLSIESEEHTYYTNDILSHNTVTIATYLLWCALTRQNINIGIAANVVSLAQEVLDKIKKIYIEMPIWLQPGLMSWNKQSVEFDNGNKIMISASNSDAFRGFSLSILYVDEVSFIRNNLWEEFMDSVMPAMAAIQDSQAIFSSTANGLNHFFHMVEGARRGENGYKLVEASWKEVPRWHKDGRQKTSEEFMTEQVAKNGLTHFNQNFGNEFLGSSHTLVNGTVLKNISYMKDEDIIFNSLFNGLRIFEEPKEGHNYILTSDPKQDGIDGIGLHVIDVTNIPFKQVASANLKESFVVIPNRVFDLGTYYNNAYVVQENNVEANLINALHDQLEYEGEIFRERKPNGKGFKNIWGIRTTTKTKKMMTSFIKKFVEEGLLIINDKQTVDELFNFIERKNGTYAAEEGYHDDLVMSLMLLFAPFFDIRNWDDFKGFSDLIEKRKEEKEEEEKETAEFLDLGFNSEESTESPFTEDIWGDSEFGMGAMEAFNQDMNDRGW